MRAAMPWTPGSARVGVELALSARIKRKRRRGLELVGEASAAKICGGGDGHQGTEMK
jgi:hypothetical protein